MMHPQPNNERKRRKDMIKELLLDYMKNSTLHGLRYVAEKGLTIIEKLFWLTTFTASLVLCSFLISKVYVKWRTSPVIVSVSERLVFVGEVPFPSVTICPQVKSKTTVYNFSNEFEKVMTKRETPNNKFLDIALVCDVSDFKLGDRLYTNESVIEHIDAVAPKIEDFMMWCSWRNETFNACDTLFNKVYTAEGVCYNMNGLAAEEIFQDPMSANYKLSESQQRARSWSIRDGYTWTDDNPFPLQGNENGASPDLEVYFENKLNDSDNVCNGLNSGFKVYIQHPKDHPQSSLFSYAVLDRQVSSMAVSAEILTSAPSVKDIPPETRQCFFLDERTLRYYKIYTSSNCRAECLSNYTLETCGCVGFHMPHDKSSRICAENSIDCMEEAQNSLAKRELLVKIRNEGQGCNCLPACDSIKYTAEILTSKYHFRRYIRKLSKHYKRDYNFTVDIEYSRFSKLEMYFKNPQFVSMQRSELFGVTDFLANIGGLLGVFLGFSFLSLIELFYFLTLRVSCALKGSTVKNLEKEHRNEKNL